MTILTLKTGLLTVYLTEKRYRIYPPHPFSVRIRVLSSEDFKSLGGDYNAVTVEPTTD